MESKAYQRFLFFLLLLSLCLETHMCFGADTMTSNQSLSGDQTIVSAGGKFELGFFKPGNASNKYYIGMWYYKSLVSLQTIVWVANREQPVFDRFSSELRISDGQLVLFNESKVAIWSTDVTHVSSTVYMHVVLLDNGNLVMKDGFDLNNSSLVLWQSFDHPAHTWLPESRIGFNTVTNQTQVLTSWKNSEDPSPGLYTLELDPNGSDAYYIIWNKSRKYWTSGAWDPKANMFAFVPEMSYNYIYNYSFVKNKTESYFSYFVKNPGYTSRLVMDVSGQINQQTWLGHRGWNLFWAQPSHKCQVYAFCGAFGSCNGQTLPFCTCLRSFEPKIKTAWDSGDYSGGCKRTMLYVGNSTTTNNGEEDQFFEMPNMNFPGNNVSLIVGDITQCESLCLSNSSCTAYGYDNGVCLIWIGDLLDLQQVDDNGKTLYLRLAASEFKDPKSKKGLIIGIAVGSAIFAAVLLGLIVFVMIRNRNRLIGKAMEGALVAFEYRDLQEVTKNFAEKLGGGGFGSVFKGTMPDSSLVAVKKLESVSQGEKQFRTEVSTIGTIQHVNLVRLRGFCSKGSKRLLVYEYMPNGSLDAHLFSSEGNVVLTWNTRYQIALGTARGLAYLHEKCRDCIIHCDIKPENILLDAHLCPKVADFGLAKLVGRQFSRVLTTMRGTRGYLAPEWISGVAITSKTDVYSYGMMLFEIVSGRRNSEPSEDSKVRFFPTWAANVITTSNKEADILSLLGTKLGRNGNVEEIIRVLRVACWCVQDDEASRPSMGQVVQILEGILDVNLPSVPRSFQVFGDSDRHIVFFTESSSSQSSSHAQNSSTSTTSSQAKSSTTSITSKRSDEHQTST